MRKDLTAELIPELIEQTFLNATEDGSIKETSFNQMRPQPLGPFQQGLKYQKRTLEL